MPETIKSNVIQLPSSSYQHPKLPSAKERFNIVKLIREHGISIGSKVIRVSCISESCINNDRFIGTVERFLFHMWPGYTEYKPILVVFKSGAYYTQLFPFTECEIELLETAQKQLDVINHQKEPETLHGKIILDILKQQHGVLPFVEHKVYVRD